MTLQGRVERHLQAGVGSIELICGPMFSGKTEELIRRLRRAEIARQKVAVFKPRIDIRYDQTQVVSHSSQKIPSIPVDDVLQIDRYLKEQVTNIDVVGIDEAQFFDERICMLTEELCGRGMRVVVAGLDQDYLGKPFGPMPTLLAIADAVTKQYAVCLGCGAPATKTQRVARDENQMNQSNELILVGETDSYEARCRRCFQPKVDGPISPRGSAHDCC